MRFEISKEKISFKLDYSKKKPVMTGEYQFNLNNCENFFVSVLNDHAFSYKNILNLKQFKIFF